MYHSVEYVNLGSFCYLGDMYKHGIAIFIEKWFPIFDVLLCIYYVYSYNIQMMLSFDIHYNGVWNWPNLKYVCMHSSHKQVS